MEDEFQTTIRDAFDIYIDVAKKLEPKVRPVIPVLPIHIVLELVRRATKLFRAEPNVLTVPFPVTVIGDLHGSLFDLLRFLRDLGHPATTPYLFLGDYIDRGSFSIETLIVLLMMKVLYPTSIFMIRGNHEFEEPCVPHTDFQAEMSSLYSSDLLPPTIGQLFAYMPLAANIADYAFAVHGGVSPSISSIHKIFEIARPLACFRPKIVEEMMWSDPSSEIVDIAPSTRGLGVRFGFNVVTQFLMRTHFKIVLRGHQSIVHGVEELFGGRLVTIFSASNYCDDGTTKAGALIVDNGAFEKRVFMPIWITRRTMVTFELLGTLRGQSQLPPLKHAKSGTKKPETDLPKKPLTLRKTPSTGSLAIRVWPRLS
jgi:protein phosphatase